MTLDEYQSLPPASKPRVFIAAAELTNQTPRTLIFGYTVDRDTVHVYLGDDGRIHVLVYSYDRVVLSHMTEPNLELAIVLPNKRAYPECCDFEFCQLLKNRGAEPSFTTFNDARELKAFHGLLASDFQAATPA